MKHRISKILLVFFLIAGSIGCNKEEKHCEECREVTEENGQVTDKSDPKEYCGDKLEEKKKEETEVGNKKKYYECS